MSGQEKQENNSLVSSPLWTKPGVNPSTTETYKAWSPEEKRRYIDSVNTTGRLVLNLTDYLHNTLGKMTASSPNGELDFAAKASAVAYEKASQATDQRTILHASSSTLSFK